MMKNYNLLLLFFALTLFTISCVNDPKNPDTVVQAEDHSGHDHTGHDHSGHDHSGHDHSGHDHSGHDHSGHDHSGNNSESSLNTAPKQVVQQKEIQIIDKEAQLQSLEEARGSVPEEQLNAKQKAIEAAKEKMITSAKVAATSTKSVYSELPDACTLVTDKFIAKTIGVDAKAIHIKDGSGPASSHARACFFRWDHNGIPNSGVMIQVEDNPLPDEFPDWASYYIQAKLDQGDMRTDGGPAYKYKKWDGGGLSGAYSYEMHQYLTRTNNNLVVRVAFNLQSTEEQELAWAKTFAQEVIKQVQ